MVAVPGDLELTELATSIEGLSPVRAAAILAETGDLTRFPSARAIVKLAGLAPRERLSGTFAGNVDVVSVSNGAGMRTSNADQITNGRSAEALEMPVVGNDRRTWISLGPPYEPPRSDRINPGAARSDSVLRPD